VFFLFYVLDVIVEVMEKNVFKSSVVEKEKFVGW